MAITISSPGAYRIFQRSDLNWADITISGTYTGSPTTIEASWNGGAYETIVASPSGGVYSGTLADQDAGQGTLAVRFGNDHAQSASVNFVGVGDVFFVIGQSNAKGSGADLQHYTHASLKASMWRVGGSTWLELDDPTSSAGGSAWPLLATLYLAGASVPFAVINCGVGSTSLVVAGEEWKKGNSSYNQALTTLANSGVNGIAAILWLQGESETAVGTTQVAYQTALSQMLDDMQADSSVLAGVKMIVAQIDGFMNATRTNLDTVRAAQAYCWDNDPDILAGPVTYDIDLTDDVNQVHFGQGADGQYEQQTLADRWWRMIRFHLLGHSEGRGYRFESAVAHGALVTVRLTSGVSPLVGQSDIRGWRVTDNGVALGVVAAVADGDERVRLALASVPSTSGPLRVSFGSGIDALNTTLMDSAEYPQPPEPFVDMPVTIAAIDSTSTILDPTFAFYVDVEDLAGNRLGGGPLTSVTRWTYTASMDKAGSFECSYLATDNQAAQVENERYLRAWALLNGVWTEVGYGRVSVVEQRPDEDGIVTVNASGLDVTVELSDRSVRKLAIGTGTGATHDAALTAISAFAPAGWVLVPADSPDNDYIYARFAGESALAALGELAKKTQTHFYRSQGRQLVFTSTFESSDIRAIQATGELTPQTCAIQSITDDIDTHGLLTREYVSGSGTGDARLTLAATSRTAPSGYVLNKAESYIEDTAATALYGLREVPEIEFKEITPIANTDADVQGAANMLFDAAMLELRRRATLAQQHTYTLTIGGCSRLLRPMQSLRVVHFDPDQNIDIDDELYILESTWEADTNGIRTSRLVVSTDDRWPSSDIDSAAERAVEGKVFIAHPQIGPNSYWVNDRLYVGSDQALHVAEFPFVLGPEVVNVERVVLRFKVEAVLSFTSIVAGETEAEVVIDNTSIDVSVTGTIDISHTHTTPDHGHSHVVDYAAVPDRTISGTDVSGNIVLHYSGSNVGDKHFNTDINPGALTSSSGGSTTLALTGSGTGTGTGTASIDLSDAIGVSYGVYRADASRTYGMDELEYAVNGGAWAPLDDGTATGDGYFEIDLTALSPNPIYDPTTFRPYQENNLVEIRRNDAVAGIAIANSTGFGTGVSFSTNPTPHSMVIGEPVIITGTTHHDGTWTVTAVPDSLDFETNQTGDNNLDTGGEALVNKSCMILVMLGVRTTIQSVSFT